MSSKEDKKKSKQKTASAANSEEPLDIRNRKTKKITIQQFGSEKTESMTFDSKGIQGKKKKDADK